jgi:hypothetical protein
VYGLKCIGGEDRSTNYVFTVNQHHPQNLQIHIRNKRFGSDPSEVGDETVAGNEGRRDITGRSHIKVVLASSLYTGKALTVDILAKHT